MFCNIAKMKSLAAEGAGPLPNHGSPGNLRFFLLAVLKSIVFYGVSGVRGRWVGGGRAAPITFGYHRRPPARTRAAAPWPAPGFKRLRATAGQGPMLR